MSKLLFTGCFLLLGTILSAQVNYSGTYGYSFKPQGNPPQTEANRGPSGTLVLQKMDGNKYRFWLDISLGWPDYGVGETDGTIVIENDTASFDNTFEGATNPCMLRFTIKGDVVQVNSVSSSYNCGFSNGVKADGQYTRTKAPAINNEWLKKEYYDAPKVIVVDARTEIYQDENAVYPFTPKKYLEKGESVLGITQTEKMVYTEFIQSPGIFTYGWVRKAAVKIVPH